MERKFYSISLTGHICRYFLGENLSSGSNNERVYGSLYLQNITVQRKGLFRDEIILKVPYQLFVYENNGTFYEFFSGKMVGTRKKAENTSSVYTSYYNKDEIVRNGYVLTSFRDFGTSDFTIRELTAVDFAKQVEQFVPYRSHMTYEMNRLLNAIDAQHKRLSDAANAKQNAAIRAEQNSQSWLDDLIKNR